MNFMILAISGFVSALSALVLGSIAFATVAEIGIVLTTI
jgi:hypothetical protein